MYDCEWYTVGSSVVAKFGQGLEATEGEWSVLVSKLIISSWYYAL